MTFRHLRIFLTVCETLNMTKAAKELHISQPSVTQAIHELEAHYGLLLFKRSGRQIFLTPAGRHLEQLASQIISLQQQAEASMHALQHQLPIWLGASITIGDVFLVDLLQHARQLWPDQEILSAVHNTEELEQLLLEDKLDLALVEGRLTSPHLTTVPILTDWLTLIASPENEWAHKTIQTARDLDHLPVFVREEGSGTRELFERVMQEHHVPYHVIGVYNNSTAIKNAVMANLGLSFLSRTLVRKEVADGRLVEVPMGELEFKRVFRIAYRKDKYLTPPMEALIDECKRSEEWLHGDREPV
ncbi:LysR family transcriptional regulator [Megasphaera hominis]|jgi:DNA-binding transcriptional LysR family regulator|uniref:LysR family transcriptional regulator n=2 Tax=Megasphaera TaxID=906 RepID=A0ABR6VJS8_9FIRM|nr:LysR family transcriptional regulator [Megasphaera hominis]MBC3537543.1 LysR family transcriptional regulator [Megasphaera hominis]